MKKKPEQRLYGGIEAGGTKFVCAAGRGPDEIEAVIRFPTTTPGETLGKAIDFFRKAREGSYPEAIGIGSFGPVDINPSSPTFGCITSTPKAGWEGTDIAGIIGRSLEIPVVLDTDVNAAALGEGRWGAARGLDTFIYLTVGTGIGGGGLVNGRLMHGLIHPEMGHLRIPHNREKDPFPGSCPYHGDCLEGLASGNSLQERWGRPPEELPSSHPAWELEAEYLALGVANLIFTLSPQRIILGGGIMKHPGLLTAVRSGVKIILHNYLRTAELTERIESYIVAPGLGDLSGVLGAMALAEGYPKV